MLAVLRRETRGNQFMNPRRRLTGPGRVVLQILPVLWKRLFWYTTQHILFIYSPALEDRKDLSLSLSLVDPSGGVKNNVDQRCSSCGL